MALQLVSSLLTALRRFSGTGLLAWTGSAIVGRTITRGLGTHVTNGSGVAGDPTIALGNSGGALTDPGADRILFWDESGNIIDWLTAGTGLNITTTSLTVDQGFSPTWTGTHRFDLAINLVSGQITFPATQVASAGANTLDDYEEQLAVDLTFTAATPPTSVTYGARSFRFTKVGRIAHGEGRLTLTSKGTGGVGALSLTGLPWTASGIGVTKNIRANNFTGGAIPGSGVGLIALISGTALGLGYSTNANDASDLTWANVTDTFDAIISFTYLANA